MTESALDRELEDALFHFHNEAAGWAKASECGNCERIKKAVARLEAAARLAGRLEQAQESVDLITIYHCDGCIRSAEVLAEERDRLRAEAAEAGKK